MKFDKNLISRLEALTMLKLSDEEKEKLIPELDKIVQMMDKIEELNLDDVEPLKHVIADFQKPRKDKVSEMIDTETALKNASKTQDNFFVVPKVIKQ